MNYRLHENGWTVILDDFNFKTASQNDIKQISDLLAKHTVVVAKQQNLSVADEVRVIEMFRDPEQIPSKWTEEQKIERRVRRLMVPYSKDYLVRVTGELDEHGEPGIFGHKVDLDWHVNHPANPERHPIVWLYGVRGTKGSKTSWVNNILSYDDFSQEEKEYLKTIKCVLGYMRGSYSPEKFSNKDVEINEYFTPNIVHTHSESRQTGLYFPFLQIHHIVGMTLEESKEFLIKIRDRILQEKYTYHHYWDDGDVVISDQWLSIHKRWAFEDMEHRLLHRACFRYI